MYKVLLTLFLSFFIGITQNPIMAIIQQNQRPPNAKSAKLRQQFGTTNKQPPVQHNKILVVAPHPDDDVIGCGGSIAKHKKNGSEVSIIYMTSGDAGDLQTSKIREREATSAESVLGVTNLHFLRNADGYLTYDQKNLIQIIDLIRQEQDFNLRIKNIGFINLF